MMLFRSAKRTDLPAIYSLANHAGHGITTLPKDQGFLQKRLDLACQSFANTSLKNPLNEYYLFVLENSSTQEIIGVSAIESAIGLDAPFYTYKITHKTQISHLLKIRSDYDLLNLANDHQGKSELCTLFLAPEHRINTNGLLLSRARFLFIATFPHRFAPSILAELRGVSDEKGHSPFWQHLGQHFFHMPFTKADSLTLTTDKQFIADLMPEHPIYVKLLPAEAQAVIGKPHSSSAAAMKILVKEGFIHQGYIDIFDAGPILEATQKQIHSIKTNQIRVITQLSEEVCAKLFLLANTKLDFRATLAPAMVDEHDCIISKKTAALLELEQGDSLCLSPFAITESLI